jgi:hypothetical protein
MDRRQGCFGVRLPFAARCRCIVTASQGGPQAGDIELRRGKVAAQMVSFGLIHGRVELDQDLPGLDTLPIAHMDGPHYAGLEGLEHLRPLGIIFPGAEAMMSTLPRNAQAKARQNSPMVKPIARPSGDGGVSISSAAGKNASSSLSPRLAPRGSAITFLAELLAPKLCFHPRPAWPPDSTGILRGDARTSWIPACKRWSEA